MPERWGGLGLGPLASATFSEALGASTFAGFDVTVLVHTDMAGPHLFNSGTTDQLERWMPGVLSGETILSIAVTEPDAGSDVAGIRTRAKKDGAGWRINGTKTFITNSVYGDLSIVAARTDLDSKYGISMFLVPKGTEGFSVAKKLDKHGWRCSDTGELVLDDVWVPDDQLLGTPHRGFYETMRNFQNERMVLVGMGVGAAQAAIDLTLAYTQDRKAFGGTLFDLGAIRQRMAMSQATIDAVRASMYHAAWLGEQGQREGDVGCQGVRGRGHQPGPVRLRAVPWRHGVHARVGDRAHGSRRPDSADRWRSNRSDAGGGCQALCRHVT